MIDPVAVRDGLARGEFLLEYLPTVSLADGRCVGAEALVRWHRGPGVVPPEEFIPAIENTSLSGLLTYRVIETVAAELGGWLRANPGAHVSLNVPPELLGRGGLRYAAEKCGLIEVASQVILEITERGVPDAIGVAAINQTGELGLRVALDDVTLVGGSNLLILARCHFHSIKLDKSLVDQITSQSPDPAWLTAVTALLKSSSLRVVAEGVEAGHQATALRTAGVQEAQGFYFSRPLPAAEFVVFHRDYGGPGQAFCRL